MLIIWGTKLAGKVDEIPGLGSVMTQFGHIWWLPLIPMGSHFIIEKTDKGWRGVKFGLSLRSTLMGYLRAWCVAIGLLLLVVGTVTYSSSGSSGGLAWGNLTMMGIGVGLAVLAWLSQKLWRWPSDNRARRICEKLGIEWDALKAELAMAAVAHMAGGAEPVAEAAVAANPQPVQPLDPMADAGPTPVEPPAPSPSAESPTFLELEPPASGPRRGPPYIR